MLRRSRRTAVLLIGAAVAGAGCRPVLNYPSALGPRYAGSPLPAAVPVPMPPPPPPGPTALVPPAPPRRPHSVHRSIKRPPPPTPAAAARLSVTHRPDARAQAH